MSDKTQQQKPLYRTYKVEEENRQFTIPATIKCFYCGLEINPDADEGFIYAQLRYQYKRGGTRYKDHPFHLPCYHQFLGLIEGQQGFSPES